MQHKVGLKNIKYRVQQ